MLTPSLSPAAGPWPRRGQQTTTFGQCLLLALLLHVLLVLLVGNVEGGRARRGEGAWGAVNVTLQTGGREGAAAAPPNLTSPGPTGAGQAPRWGGAVRDQAPPPGDQPGAAREGEFGAPPVPPAPPAPPLPPPPRLPAALPTPEPRTPVAPLSPTPAALAWQAPSLPAAPSATLDSHGRLAAPPQVPGMRDALPATPTTVAPQAEPARAMPALPQAAAALERRLAPLPALAPAAAVAPSLERADAVAPAAALTAPALAPLPAPAAPAAAAPAPAPAPHPPAVPSDPPATAPEAGPGALPLLPAPALPAGQPDAGPRVGLDRANPPSAAASAPRLNLELSRQRGGELSSTGGRGVLPLLARPAEVKSKLATEIERAAKPDCKDKYAGMGVLAVVPLAAEALKRDGGCKW